MTRFDDERARFEKAKAELTYGGGLLSRRFEWCESWRDIFEEWDEIHWTLPVAERHYGRVVDLEAERKRRRPGE